MAVSTDLKVDETDKLVEINHLCKMAAGQATFKDLIKSKRTPST